MLSILLPTYNYDVQPLVHDLLHQARQLNIPFEIIVEDDASPDLKICSENHSLVAEPEVTYVQHHGNMGRSKIRNHLAQAAHYPFLLFLDCDAGMKQSNFISQYVQYIRFHQNPELPFVVLGGVAYREMTPDPAFRLRWKYGLAREQKTAAIRNMNPYCSFTPFNMLVSKAVFEKVSFDENFTQYGFEDTFFGYQLQQKKISVSHIDNEMYHDGLDANAVYVDKVMCAVDNLAALYTAQKLPADFVKDSRLLQTYLRCKKVYMTGLVGLVLRLLKRPLRWCAVKTVSLNALDMLKLERLIAALKH
ncbi:MAG: glycosyltransferase family 2 protein [Bacteroidales bacterium]|nr:glycosyltransferase family 2 protein [Bacteroidales bacterium]